MGKRGFDMRGQDRTMYAGRLQYKRQPLLFRRLLLAAMLALILLMVATHKEDKMIHRAWNHQARQEWQITTMIVCEQGLIWIEEGTKW